MLKIHANLIIGADGRHSLVRSKSNLSIETFGVPMDVLWFRLSRQQTDIKQSLGKIDMGHILIMIERGDYWQCGFLIRKGAFQGLQDKGLEAFRQNVASVLPEMSERVNEINSWEDIKLLTVVVDHLRKWHQSGLLCIGDAAHAMSPIGGIGINLAIQDAVATANVLIPAFLSQTLTENTLAAVQKRRALPTKFYQHLQVFIQNHIIDHVLDNPIHPSLPLILKLFQRFPYLCRLPAYLIGVGIRPEHLKH